jgi:alkylated DNA repair dioxygenase AlkB
MHADDEKELGVNANIASVSLGDTRTFILSCYRTNPKWNPDPNIEYAKSEPPGGHSHHGYTEYELTNGSLLIMSGATQHYWKHEIPKAVLTAGQIKMGIKPVGPRINLTFRKFYSV